MSKKNDDFFSEKKPWSIYKDKLLGCYLIPYFQKIFCSHKPLVYVDCFAGKGRFDDGQKGSPLIALDCINKATEHSSSPDAKVKKIFIELKYSDELKKNLFNSGISNYRVIGEKFEDNVENILETSRGNNLFIYFDPYGIKALDMKTFISFSSQASYHCSTEILINFNSFGLFRNCCKLLKVNVSEQSMNNLAEYDTSSIESENGINKVFGDDSWKIILNQYICRQIDSYTAERKLTNLFCKKLNAGYNYVINMPIRAKNDTNPKYRMIHATNHKDGCLIMAENMFKISNDLRDDRSDGQMGLFDLGVEDNITNNEIIKDGVFKSITDKNKTLNDILIDFYLKYGIVASKSSLIGILKELRQENKTIETRFPEHRKNGKETCFYEDKKDKHLWIRRM